MKHLFLTDTPIFFGDGDYKTSSTSKYSVLEIAETSNAEQFKSDLIAHQQGRTDYLTFCNDCAKSGIEKWAVSMNKMTCIYYDKAGNEILVEAVPTP